MSDTRTTHVLASQSGADHRDADARGSEFTLACSLAAIEGGVLENAEVEAAVVELARRLGDLRVMLTRYVLARRAAAVPVARVLAEVRQVVRLGAAQEAWPDPNGALTRQAVRCALGVYHEHGWPAALGVLYAS